jgi:hypothetical protein
MSLLTQFTGGKVLIEKRQLFTASGTWTRPAEMVGNPVLTMIGGGASGNVGGARIGGDGGQYIIDHLVDIGATTSLTVTIGAGGAAATTTTKSAGASSSFGAFVTVLGGAGGTAYTGQTALGASGSVVGSVSIDSVGQSTPLGTGGGGEGNASGAGGGGGGGGLIEGSADIRGGCPRTTDRAARGYGAGGAGIGSGTSGAGAAGVCLVKWMETV